MKNLFLFVLSLLLLVTGKSQSLKAFGDSNTFGFGASTPDKTWFSLLTSTLNLQGTNYGVAGATIYGTSGLETLRSHASEGAKDWVTIMYGTNDSYAGIVNDQWKADYERFIRDNFVDAGYNKNKIIIICPSDFGTTTNPAYVQQMQLVRNYCQQISNDLGIKYVDLYGEILKCNTAPPSSVYYKPTWWLGDGTHLNDYGHKFLSDLLVLQIKQLPTPLPGAYRVKNFGAGTAMAGATSYLASYEHLFATETG